MEVVKEFSSKKNKVKLVRINGKNIVLKSFIEPEGFFRELSVYNKITICNGFIPKVFSYNIESKELFLEYLDGVTLLEYLEICEIKNHYETAYLILVKFFKWLYTFHKLKIFEESKHVLYDVNFRNFIICEDQVFGIDFEDVQVGLQINDYIKAIAMYLLYDPIESSFKKRVVNQLLLYLDEQESYKIDVLNNMINKEIGNIKNRRSNK